MNPWACLAVRPLDPNVRPIGGAEPEVNPTQLTADMTAADGQLAAHCRLTDLHIDPGADRVAVRAFDVGELQAEPVARPIGSRRVARTGIPPQLQRCAEVDLDEVEQPVEVEVRERRTATAVEAEDAGRIGALLEGSVRLTERMSLLLR